MALKKKLHRRCRCLSCEGTWVWAYSSTSRWSRNHPMVETALDSWERFNRFKKATAWRNLENSAVFNNKEKTAHILAWTAGYRHHGKVLRLWLFLVRYMQRQRHVNDWFASASAVRVVQRSFFFKSWNLCGFHDPKSDQRIGPATAKHEMLLTVLMCKKPTQKQDAKVR